MYNTLYPLSDDNLSKLESLKKEENYNIEDVRIESITPFSESEIEQIDRFKLMETDEETILLMWKKGIEIPEATIMAACFNVDRTPIDFRKAERVILDMNGEKIERINIRK